MVSDPLTTGLLGLAAMFVLILAQASPVVSLAVSVPAVHRPNLVRRERRACIEESKEFLDGRHDLQLGRMVFITEQQFERQGGIRRTDDGEGAIGVPELAGDGGRDNGYGVFSVPNDSRSLAELETLERENPQYDSPDSPTHKVGGEPIVGFQTVEEPESLLRW